MRFLKKHFGNIVFIIFIVFLFTPYGLPVRALLIKGVSYVNTRVFNLEVEKKDRIKLKDYDWKLVNVEGKEIDFNSVQNKVVIVNFWATWCPPCIAEMPSFQKLYNEYKNEVTFLFVAQDDLQKVKKFITSNNYTLPVYFEMSEGPAEMRANSLPTTYILNKSGEIVVDKVGAVDWNSSKVREILDYWAKK